jgi:copper chaperone CopZ
MKRIFKLEDLECANCAAKMERAINEIKGVKSATVSYMQQKLVLETDEELFDDILKQAQKIIKKIEPDCRIMR